MVKFGMDISQLIKATSGAYEFITIYSHFFYPQVFAKQLKMEDTWIRIRIPGGNQTWHGKLSMFVWKPLDTHVFLFLLGFIARGYPSKLMLLNILEFLPQFTQFRSSKAVTYGPKYLV